MKNSNQEDRKAGEMERVVPNALSRALAIGLGTSRSTFLFSVAAFLFSYFPSYA